MVTQCITESTQPGSREIDLFRDNGEYSKLNGILASERYVTVVTQCITESTQSGSREIDLGTKWSIYNK
jgi:hypothetical protein